jgi:GDP-L-fucose synthase
MCQAYNEQYGCNFISLMPTNLYGNNDNFDLKTSHVLPALIRKFHEGKLNGKQSIELWGSGFAKREFLHVDDLAEACIFLMKNPTSQSIINVGYGKDISILDLAQLVKKVVKYKGDILFDNSGLDGVPRKILDISKLTNLGWRPSISLEYGVRSVYEHYKIFIHDKN